jgi:hypothetical protein
LKNQITQNPKHGHFVIEITTPSVSTSLSPGCFELPFLSQPRLGFLGLSHPIFGPPVPILDTLQKRYFLSWLTKGLKCPSKIDLASLVQSWCCQHSFQLEFRPGMVPGMTEILEEPE